MNRMSFYTSFDQKNYIEKLGTVTAKFAERAFELDESRGFPFENIKDLKAFGYLTYTLPKEYGGQGATLYDYLLAQEQIATHCGPTALSIGWHVGIVQNLVEKRSWAPEVLDEFFHEVARGGIVNSAASEAGTGSPTRGGRPETTAIKDGDNWIINGRKNYTTLSPVLSLILVTAWVDEENTVGTFLIHRDLEGVKVEETWDVISMQGTGSHDIVLENVRIADKYFVARQSKVKPVSEGWLLHIPACYLGIATAARNYAVDFAKSYTPNSLPEPIKELPTVQRVIGEIELDLFQMRHVLYSVAEKWQSQPENRDYLVRELAAVKISVTNQAIAVVDKAMRVVGAKSLQRTNPLQRYYRDVRAGLHNPPMDDAIITLLAKAVLDE